MNKRVKIVATLGPAVEIRGGKNLVKMAIGVKSLMLSFSSKIAELITEGANVFRFNFSHGDHAEQGERMATVRRAEELARQRLDSFLILKDLKCVQNCLQMVSKNMNIRLVINFV